MDAWNPLIYSPRKRDLQEGIPSAKEGAGAADGAHHSQPECNIYFLGAPARQIKDLFHPRLGAELSLAVRHVVSIRNKGPMEVRLVAQ